MDASDQIPETPGRFASPAGGGGGHTDAVRDLTAGRWEGRTVFASGSDDRTLRLWEAATGQPLGHALTGHAGRVRYAAFAGPHRDILITGDDSGVVLRWRSDAGVPRSESFARLESRIVGLGVANVDGRALVGVGTGDGVVRIIDAVTGEHHAEVRVDAGWELNRADIGVLDGRLVALTIARDPAMYRPSLATLTMWDVASGRPLYEPGGVPEETEGLGTFATLDGQLVAIRGIDPYHGFGDGVDVDDEQELDRTEHGFDEEDEDEDDNPYQSEYFLEETDDFWIVDVATRKVLKEYRRPPAGASVATFARSGRRFVALVPLLTVINVIDAGVGAESEGLDEFQYTGHSANVCCVATAELDGRTIVASGDSTGNMRFWDLDTPERSPHPRRSLPFQNS
ncbi:WD40 repeat domain-containing protein [Micromonospora saelicesensis]|uniref:WD40 repeat domain-containing protein n=1 Tax=Micromonospora saelicesensis TaxID=285676 RepID=UPI003CE8014B